MPMLHHYQPARLTHTPPPLPPRAKPKPEFCVLLAEALSLGKKKPGGVGGLGRELLCVLSYSSQLAFPPSISICAFRCVGKGQRRVAVNNAFGGRWCSLVVLVEEDTMEGALAGMGVISCAQLARPSWRVGR